MNVAEILKTVDIVEIHKEGLKRKRAELQDVLNQLVPLEKRRAAIQEDIGAYERLIASGTEEQGAFRLGDIIGKPPIFLPGI